MNHIFFLSHRMKPDGLSVCVSVVSISSKQNKQVDDMKEECEGVKHRLQREGGTGEHDQDSDKS